jgi:hypothetical protein
MLDGDVLHPFAQQSAVWDDLWLEQDNGRALREFTVFYRDNEQSEADKAAVNDTCLFFMRMKANTRCYQQQVDWGSPSSRVKQVLDTVGKSASAPVASARKSSKQQRNSTSGAIRNLSEPLAGLAAEWNTEAETAWVWKDNQEGAALADPWLFTRLLQKGGMIPAEGDYLSQGKKVLPISVLSNTCKKHYLVSTPYPYQSPFKGGKGKGRDGKGKFGKDKGKRLQAQASSSVSDAVEAELWMLPYPESVNQEDGSYLILGRDQQNVRVTKENWETLRFNTKTMNPEYFPSSYLNPVPTGPSLEDPEADVSFPRSTITGTVEELRLLLKVPLLKAKKISSEIFKALSLPGPTGASNVADERTASKRIRVFLKLCAVFIPCQHEDYYHAVAQLDAELHSDASAALQPYLHVRDEILVNIGKRVETAVSVLLQALYALQQGHVQYLLREYRNTLVDQFGPDALPPDRNEKPARRKVKSRISSGPPRDRRALGDEPSKQEEGTTIEVDNDDIAGSKTNYSYVEEDDEAHTSVSSTTQQEAHRLQMEMTTTSETTEAAGFGSDTSPRTESGDYDELSQAGSN